MFRYPVTPLQICYGLFGRGMYSVDYQFLPQQFDRFKNEKKITFRLSLNNDTPLCPLAARTHAANQAFDPSRIIEPGRRCMDPRPNYQAKPHPIVQYTLRSGSEPLEAHATEITSWIISHCLAQTLRGEDR